MWKLLITTERRKTMEAIHPGEHLAEELKEMRMSAAEFSRQIGVPTNRVTQILNGRRSITGDTALRLAHFFGTSAEFWLNLQSLYEIRLAEKKWAERSRRCRQSRITNPRICDHHAQHKVWTGRDGYPVAVSSPTLLTQCRRTQAV
jgi:addiction module HigA family antidote